MDTIASRLIAAMSAKGISQYQLSIDSGVPQPTIARIRTGESAQPKKSTLDALAKALGVTYLWLYDGGSWPEFIPVPTTPIPKPDPESRLIHRFNTGGSMGGGLELRDQPGVIQSVCVTDEWLRKNVRQFTAAENLCIVTGFGDSMKPTYNPGDPLLVDLGVTMVEFDSVYFFRIGNEGYVKRLQRIPSEGGLVIKAISDNRSAYDPFEIRATMDFQVFGRVLKVWRSEDF